jgi:actin-like ATPase involved in cell morphogenesis
VVFGPLLDQAEAVDAAGVGYSLGVDLGTTFVAAAISRGGHPEMVTLGGRSVVIPSVVFLDEDGLLLCGEAAVRRSVSDPHRAALGFKRRLGNPTPVRMGGETRPAIELLAAMLGEVLRVVTDAECAPPARVLLTRPANWGPFRRELFAEVAHLAGLGETPTVTEPAAAATHYTATRELAGGQIVAVYDLGGGTFDVTVLRAHPEHMEILGVPEGIQRLGGIDFDEALFAHLDHESDGALTGLDPRDPPAAVALARVRQDCVLAKEHLSADRKTVIPVFLPERNFDVRVTRTQFEDLIRAHVESTIGAMERTLCSSQLSAADLDAVLLVGGSSRIPLVAEMLTEALHRPIVVDTHPKYAVALGAAALAAKSAEQPVSPVPPTETTSTDETSHVATSMPGALIERTFAEPSRASLSDSQLQVQRAMTLRLSDPSDGGFIELIRASEGGTPSPSPPRSLLSADHNRDKKRATRLPGKLVLTLLLVAGLALAGVGTAVVLASNPASPGLVAAAPTTAAQDAAQPSTALPSPATTSAARPSPAPSTAPPSAGCTTTSCATGAPQTPGTSSRATGSSCQRPSTTPTACASPRAAPPRPTITVRDSSLSSTSPTPGNSKHHKGPGKKRKQKSA